MAKYVNKNSDGNLEVKLEVRLDAALAPVYMDELRVYTKQDIKKILLFAGETEYMSSAGIRVILFAKQKISQDAEVCLIAPKPFVTETLQLTGLYDYLTVLDDYEGKTTI
ncbi:MULTISPECIES: STAS domain-containing protein [unclassified Fusibacter]|uniref:STAS domain-containing protein n=1 Tax=unclassified Fusibacter TaxID=2624464 RepID=UPI0010124DF6|nr:MULTISPECIES: STAS domain-containing protein [unclassified Fusibacter]MCK8058468.1 STAS domain-containing protein [Fusibacter sp. A2]NPE22764.1 STAS domain-containing protein [Fusibacter sp. A1]RXV60322.1 anti-sigma factor antagonist [Fusibacter sp. A1]